CNRYSRVSGRCGASRKAVRRAYSPLVSATAAPVGSVSDRVRRSSCHPPKRTRPPSRGRSGVTCPDSLRRRSTAPTRAPSSPPRRTGPTPRRGPPQVERFRYVVVGADLQSAPAIDLVPAMTGGDDHRDVRAGSNLAQEAEPVPPAEPQIENHETRLGRGELTR